jgi:hypothetical protein
MIESIKANIKLRCTLRCYGAPELVVDGFTRELARDYAVVDAGIDIVHGWLQPGRQVTLAIELPPFRQQAPRILECGATAGRLRLVDGYSRLELEIQSMAVAKREDHRRSAGGGSLRVL